MPPLHEISVYELDMGSPGWREVYGAPLYWAPDGLDWIAISPAPRGGAIWVEGYMEPPTLSKDSDYIDLGDEELLRILDYAQWYLSFKEAPREALDNTQVLLDNMLQAGALRNARIRQSALYREYMGEHRELSERPGDAPVSKVGIRNKE